MRSIIGSPGRTFPAVHPLDVMADTRALERACYEESLKSRPGAVSSSGGSITRGAPVIVPELGKPRQSPLTYEDHAAPFASHLPRGSPVTTREPTPRLQEGAWGGARGGAGREVGRGHGVGRGLGGLRSLKLPYHPLLSLGASSGPPHPFHLPDQWVLPPNHPQASHHLSATSRSPGFPDFSLVLLIICSPNGSLNTFLKYLHQITPLFCLNLSSDFSLHLGKSHPFPPWPWEPAGSRPTHLSILLPNSFICCFMSLP